MHWVQGTVYHHPTTHPFWTHARGAIPEADVWVSGFSTLLEVVVPKDSGSEGFYQGFIQPCCRQLGPVSPDLGLGKGDG